MGASASTALAYAELDPMSGPASAAASPDPAGSGASSLARTWQPCAWRTSAQKLEATKARREVRMDYDELLQHVCEAKSGWRRWARECSIHGA